MVFIALAVALGGALVPRLFDVVGLTWLGFAQLVFLCGGILAPVRWQLLSSPLVPPMRIWACVWLPVVVSQWLWEGPTGESVFLARPLGRLFGIVIGPGCFLQLGYLARELSLAYHMSLAQREWQKRLGTSLMLVFLVDR